MANFARSSTGVKPDAGNPRVQLELCGVVQESVLAPVMGQKRSVQHIKNKCTLDLCVVILIFSFCIGGHLGDFLSMKCIYVLSVT